MRGLPLLGELLVAGVVLCTATGCGRTSYNDGQNGGPFGAAGTSTVPDDVSGVGGSNGASGEAGGAPDGGNVSTPAAGSAGVAVVDPQISRAWRWQACGSISAPRSSALQVLFLPGETAPAVLYDDGRVLLHTSASPSEPRLLRAAGNPPQAIAFSLDGAQLAEVRRGLVRVSRPNDGAASTAIDMAPATQCTGTNVRFSAEGDLVLAWDLASLCVWQVQSGALVTSRAGQFSSAALAAGNLFAAEVGSPPRLTSTPLTNAASTVIALEAPPGLSFPTEGMGISPDFTLSPRGDSVGGLTLSSGVVSVSLWSTEGRFRGTFPTNALNPPSYSSSGAFVIAGNQVVEVTSNQLRYQFSSELLTEVSSALFSVDDTGSRVAGLEPIGQTEQAAQVFDLAGREGPRLLSSLPSIAFITDLAVSQSGTRLAVASPLGGALYRIAANFEDSEAIRRLSPELLLDVNFTADGREVLASGDGWLALASDDGSLQSANVTPPEVPAPGPALACIHTSARVSPRGTYLASGRYSANVDVLAWPVSSTMQGARAVLSPTECNARAAFNADETLIALTGPEVYRTSDWSLVWATTDKPMVSGPNAGDLYQDVQFSPDGQSLLSSRCSGIGLSHSAGAEAPSCVFTLLSVADGELLKDLPELHARRAAFSSEGQWLVSGNTALHLPSGDSVTFSPDAELATFAPNGDILAVLPDNTLARYCRTP